MKLNVTFSQKDMSFRPAFDTIIPMDISAVSVQGLLDGSLSGTYENDKIVSISCIVILTITKGIVGKQIRLYKFSYIITHNFR